MGDDEARTLTCLTFHRLPSGLQEAVSACTPAFTLTRARVSASRGPDCISSTTGNVHDETGQARNCPAVVTGSSAEMVRLPLGGSQGTAAAGVFSTEPCLFEATGRWGQRRVPSGSADWTLLNEWLCRRRGASLLRVGGDLN